MGFSGSTHIIEGKENDAVHDMLREELLSVRPADNPSVDRHYKTFSVVSKNDAGQIIGGAYAYLHPGWVYIDLLWVAKEQRGNGMGQRLLREAETEATRRGCHSAYLWTQDFEAPEFYEKQGYKRFVVMEDFIPGHQRIGFMKRLAA